MTPPCVEWDLLPPQEAEEEDLLPMSWECLESPWVPCTTIRVRTPLRRHTWRLPCLRTGQWGGRRRELSMAKCLPTLPFKIGQDQDPQVETTRKVNKEEVDPDRRLTRRRRWKVLLPAADDIPTILSLMRGRLPGLPLSDPWNPLPLPVDWDDEFSRTDPNVNLILLRRPWRKALPDPPFTKKPPSVPPPPHGQPPSQVP